MNRRGFFGAIAAALGCLRGHTQGIHSAEPLKELNLPNLQQALDDFAAMQAQAVEVLRPTYWRRYTCAHCGAKVTIEEAWSHGDCRQREKEGAGDKHAAGAKR